MSAGYTLPLDEIALVRLTATRKDGSPGVVPADATVTSDNPAVVVSLGSDATGAFYTATATAKTGSANINFTLPGTTVPADVVLCTIGAAADNPIVSIAQQTGPGQISFTPNPTPPTV